MNNFGDGSSVAATSYHAAQAPVLWNAVTPERGSTSDIYRQ